jgi:hypothetical protein
MHVDFYTRGDMVDTDVAIPVLIGIGADVQMAGVVFIM